MKKKCFLVIGLLSLIGLSFTNLYSQIPTNGLIGFYPFNANANDESGNSNNATISGVKQVSDRFGNSNKAYSFNGISNYITLPNTYDSLPRTINLWFNIADTDYSDWKYIYVSDNPKLKKGACILEFKAFNGILKLLIAAGDSKDTVDILKNTWYNASLYVGVDKSVKFYLNGNLIESKTLNTYLTSVNGLNKIVLGAARSASERFFKGLIDDLRFYNRELSQNEIEIIYNEGLCINYVSVADTLIIKTNLVSSNPLVYNNTFKIYPNPTKELITIDCGNNFSLLLNNSIKITNSLGQTMFSSKISQQLFQIDLSKWSGNGLYLLYILDSQNKIIDIRKIVLE
jgi:hypothetical protein